METTSKASVLDIADGQTGEPIGVRPFCFFAWPNCDGEESNVNSCLRSRFAILEQVHQALVYAFDGAEKILHSRGFASHFAGG